MSDYRLIAETFALGSRCLEKSTGLTGLTGNKQNANGGCKEWAEGEALSFELL